MYMYISHLIQWSLFCSQTSQMCQAPNRVHWAIPAFVVMASQGQWRRALLPIKALFKVPLHTNNEG